MNPGPLALLLKEFGRDEMSEAFVGTRAIAPGSTSIAAEGSLVPRDKYNSIMLLNREAVRSDFPSSRESFSKKRQALTSVRVITS
jgi:hypothetical protein